ncbi:MAG: MFS transporter [Acidimicrobiia bacterium]|nr:MFS transporter [Acidimicrobiia bacterium]
MKQLYLVAAVTMAGVSAIFALFAELEKRYDLSTTSLGWIAGSAFLTGLVAQLWLSRYADRGHAAALLRAGVVAAAVGLLWFAAATEVWQFVAARGLLGAGVGMIIPPARRAIVVTSEGNSGERLGTFYASYLAGFVFGPPIAGALTVIGDVRLPFLVFGLATLAMLASILSMELPESDAPFRPPGHADRRVLRRLITDRRMIAALLVIVSFRYSIGVFEPLWATHLDDLGASTAIITLSLTGFALPMLIVARPAGRLSDRFGPRWASLLAALATVPMMATYGYAGVVWVIFAVAIPHGLMEAIMSPGSQAAVAEAAPERDAASAQGLAEASGSAAAAIGAFTAPALFDALGAGPAWLIAAAVMGGLLSSSWLLDPPRRPAPIRAGGAATEAGPSEPADHPVRAAPSVEPLS